MQNTEKEIESLKIFLEAGWDIIRKLSPQSSPIAKQDTIDELKKRDNKLKMSSLDQKMTLICSDLCNIYNDMPLDDNHIVSKKLSESISFLLQAQKELSYTIKIN